MTYSNDEDAGASADLDLSPSLAATLMVQGTMSDAGKSLLVAGLCRCFADMDIHVAPFKPQNMALNSAVTTDGKEIGRAQALQAKAARQAPTVDMNPVLLKPNTDTGAQVIIHGKPVADMEAVAYHNYKTTAMKAVLESHQRLQQQYQLIVVEGAGSPAEINLRDRDIANMGFAEAVDCPVILIADIDRGGVFAQLVGTLDLLSPSEQARVKGFVINKFRGDIALLQSGLEWLEQRTGKPVLGVLPWIHQLDAAAEDAIAVEQQLQADDIRLRIKVPVFSRISNHTDFDTLRQHPQVDLTYVGRDDSLTGADLIILPGSKHTRADLALLKACGWADDIARHLRYGGKVLGICGGYQMLGERVLDPDGIEGQAGVSTGFGYLPVETTLAPDKALTNDHGTLLIQPDLNDGSHPASNVLTVAVSGYQIHAGRSRYTHSLAAVKPFARLSPSAGDSQLDGCVSDDNQIAGTYLHGVFDQPDALQHLLRWAGAETDVQIDYDRRQEDALDRLALACREHLDLEQILSLAQP